MHQIIPDRIVSTLSSATSFNKLKIYNDITKAITDFITKDIMTIHEAAE